MPKSFKSEFPNSFPNCTAAETFFLLFSCDHVWRLIQFLLKTYSARACTCIQDFSNTVHKCEDSCFARLYSRTWSTTPPTRGRWARRAGWLGPGASLARWRGSGRSCPARPCSPVGCSQWADRARATQPTHPASLRTNTEKIQVSVKWICIHIALF